MNSDSFDFKTLTASTELATFLRSELSQIITFDAPNGIRWNPNSIATQISTLDSIPGTISDDAITHFLRGRSPRRTAILAIAGFLLEFEFVTAEDLRHFDTKGYSRAASALAQFFEPGNDDHNTELINRLVGEYRDYRVFRKDRIAESTILLVSPDNGRILTATERLVVYRLADLEWFLTETSNLSPSRHYDIATTLRESEHSIGVRHETVGIGSVTAGLFFLAMARSDAFAESLIRVTEVHYKDGQIGGLRAMRSTRWLTVDSGQIIQSDTDELIREMSEAAAVLELYPQEIAAEPMPELGNADEEASRIDGRGRTFNFMADKATERMNLIGAAASIEQKIEAALSACANEDERMALAMQIFCPDQAVDAVKAGADVNRLHPVFNLPMVHAAASLGCRELVRAIIETGKCDLTQRDRFGRLASTCADNCAGDFELRDELVMAQTDQFRDRGIDPRRPTVPNYGHYILK